MTILQSINIGGYANDGTGDDLRAAFKKVNDNFTVLGGLSGIIDGTNLGTGTSIFAQRNNTTVKLEFKTLTSTDTSVTITNTANTVNLKAKTKLLEDTSPKLGADLDINGRVVRDIAGGGDVQTTVYGINVPILSSLMSLLIQSNQLNVDLGELINPPGSGSGAGSTGFVIDMVYLNNPVSNILDFGTF